MLGELILAARLAASPLPCPPPVLDPAMIKEWSQNSAVITSDGRAGLGVVVGWGEGEAWVAMPSHILFGDDRTPDDPESFLVHMHVVLGGNQTAPLCPDGPGHANPRPAHQGADLAFLCVEWKGTPAFNPALLAGNIRVGDELRLAGPTVPQDVHGRVAKITSADATPEGSSYIEARELAGSPGESGALTVSAAGVVGLYLGKQENGRTMSIATIRAKAHHSNVPWSLNDAEFYDCNETRRVCATPSGTVFPESIEMKNVHVPLSRSIVTGSCGDVPEGKYQIVSSRDTICEPKFMTVLRSEDPLNIALRCAPKLSGSWRTENGDTLLCVENDVWTAQCTGLTQLGYGYFVGTLSSSGKKITMSGNFGVGNQQYSANGDLTWTPGVLTGTIRRQQNTPTHIDLKLVEDQ